MTTDPNPSWISPLLAGPWFGRESSGFSVMHWALGEVWSYGNIGALKITYNTILGVPYYKYSMMGPTTLF